MSKDITPVHKTYVCKERKHHPLFNNPMNDFLGTGDPLFDSYSVRRMIENEFRNNPLSYNFSVSSSGNTIITVDISDTDKKVRKLYKFLRSKYKQVVDSTFPSWK